MHVENQWWRNRKGFENTYVDTYIIMYLCIYIYIYYILLIIPIRFSFSILIQHYYYYYFNCDFSTRLKNYHSPNMHGNYVFSFENLLFKNIHVQGCSCKFEKTNAVTLMAWLGYLMIFKMPREYSFTILSS